MTAPSAPGRPVYPTNDVLDRLAGEQISIGQLLSCDPARSVYTADHNGVPVVVTILTTDKPKLVARHLAEQHVYRQAANGCPLPIPTLRYADPQMTITSRLAGEPLHDALNPGPLSQKTVLDLLDRLDQLYAWIPTHLVRQPVTDVQLRSYINAGLLSAGSTAAIRVLLHQHRQLRVELGIVDPRRILAVDDQLSGITTVRDLAWRLPGHDWAQMHVRWAPANPWLGRVLYHRAATASISGPYAARLMLTACREHHRHETASGAGRAVVQAQLEMAREHLRRVYEEYW